MRLTYVCENIAQSSSKTHDHNFTWEIINHPEHAKFNNNGDDLFIAEPYQKILLFGDREMTIKLILTKKITLKQLINYYSNFLSQTS